MPSCPAARESSYRPLLDEVACWQTDDFWQHALLTAVACIRADASRSASPVCQDLTQRPGHQRHNDRFGTQSKRSSEGRKAAQAVRAHVAVAVRNRPVDRCPRTAASCPPGPRPGEPHRTAPRAFFMTFRVTERGNGTVMSTFWAAEPSRVLTIRAAAAAFLATLYVRPSTGTRPAG